MIYCLFSASQMKSTCIMYTMLTLARSSCMRAEEKNKKNRCYGWYKVAIVIAYTYTAHCKTKHPNTARHIIRYERRNGTTTYALTARPRFADTVAHFQSITKPFLCEEIAFPTHLLFVVFGSVSFPSAQEMILLFCATTLCYYVWIGSITTFPSL